MKLNIVNNIGSDVCTSSDTYIHNISAGISSSSNNLLYNNNFDEYFMNNEKDKSHETDFSLHYIPINCLF